ncbi:hypothetical protein MLD38_025239 [Melastoma candidum]|uniref:Uncharacterized protein n=1 Tax=Melastoma candidum TaxID=119954 RepID=A0ACB9P1N6_9MYRT|nr:hypothetical protein MLD38_025239 [Melastoma candidum]
MSDEGEKTCPLCAEEMDLTDQQLRPCKCGYEICVWCWHHIMEMAEKNDSEGRCPACRTPYDKEKIVGMTANCERLMAEANTEKKSKSQKAKTKVTEGRKQLTSVRVIQRNLVYIVGLPLHMADEDLLQRRDYFGQYGKVLKVSMSRTSAGVIQQFPNNTCSVYITYSREEEAVRCIQSVHGYVLEGKPLRACFGTTKYCHAWLRNMSCNNPDCLYLHEVGPHEDSFTKDEVISAYTRTRVQQLTGNPSSLQRRCGNALPPPFDDYSVNSSSGKPTVKNTPFAATSIVKGSSTYGSKHISLPAAASWGTRASSLQSVSAISYGHTRQKSDSMDNVLNAVCPTSSDAVKKTPAEEPLHWRHAKGEWKSSSHPKQPVESSTSDRSDISDGIPDPSEDTRSFSCIQSQGDSTSSFDGLLGGNLSSDHTWESYSFDEEKEGNRTDDVDLSDMPSALYSVTLDSNCAQSVGGSYSANAKGTLTKLPSSENMQQQNMNMDGEIGSEKPIHSNDQPHFQFEKQTIQIEAPNVHNEVEDDVLTFDNRRQKDPEVVHSSAFMSKVGSLSRSSSHLTMTSLSFPHNETFGRTSPTSDPVFVDSKHGHNPAQSIPNSSNMSNGYYESSSYNISGINAIATSSIPPCKVEKGWTGEWPASVAGRNGILDAGESTIISNILSLDVDALDDSLTSPHNLAKLLGETDEQPGLRQLTSRKMPNSNQSRFSFARQEETAPAIDGNASFSFPGKHERMNLTPGFPESREPLYAGSGSSNGFYSLSFSGAENSPGNQFGVSPGRNSMSRSQMVAPPGFSVPSKAPPPGFSSRDKPENILETSRGVRNTSTWLSNAQQPPLGGNIGHSPDIEFMDPAILAVGKGSFEGGFSNSSFDLNSSYGIQSTHFERDSRLQSMMQGSLPAQRNLSYIPSDNYSSMNGSFGTSQRILDRSSMGELPPFSSFPIQQGINGLVSNGSWEGWNDIQSGDGLSISQLLRMDNRLGLNKYSDGFEDSKFWMPISGDLYNNKTFGFLDPKLGGGCRLVADPNGGKLVDNCTPNSMEVANVQQAVGFMCCMELEPLKRLWRRFVGGPWIVQGG